VERVTLDQQRQVMGLWGIRRKIANLSLRLPLGEQYAYWIAMRPEWDMITEAQREALSETLSEIFALHASLPQGMTGYVQQLASMASCPMRHLTNELELQIRSRSAGAKGWIGRAPASVSKALDRLQAYVECRPMVGGCETLAELVCLDLWDRDVENARDEVMRQIRDLYQTHLDDVRAVPMYGGDCEQPQIAGHYRPSDSSHTFWVSRDDHELDDAFRFMRFVEHFSPAGLSEVEIHVRCQIEAELLDHAAHASWNVPIMLNNPSWAAEPGSRTAARLWPLVDLPDAVSFLRPTLELGFRVVCACTHRDGFLVNPLLPYRFLDDGGRHREWLPNDYTTAAACLFLSLARSPQAREIAQLQARYLLQRQHHEGYWRNRVQEEETGEQPIPDINATCLAIRALLRQEADIGDAATRAKDWLLSQQLPIGEWPDLHGAPPFDTTILVLDTLREIGALQAARQKTCGYLRTAIDLCVRSRENLMQADPVSLQVAAILGFQAVELFAYSVLKTDEVDVSIFDGDATIGFRKALIRIEEHLRSTGELQPGQVIRGRPRLENLRYIRGEVVHKGRHVSNSEAQEGVDIATDFIVNFCERFHGYSPLVLPR
jgi:hypothetical protein